MNSATVASGIRALALGRDTVAMQPALRLAGYVAECVQTGVARRVLLVRLSALPLAWARPHHLRMVRAALEPLASASRAQVFHLPAGDIAIVWRGSEDAALARSRDAIAHLFQDAATIDAAALMAVLELPGDADLLIAELGLEAAAPPGPMPAREPQWPLDLATLLRLERGLDQADIARFVRRRRVCADAAGTLRPLWERRVLALPEAAGTVLPGIDLDADPWLRRRLTRTFDRRMLALLAAADELREAGPFAVGLNVASVLGPAFLRLDAGLPRHLRGEVVLEFDAADVVADLAAWGFARDFARSRRYRMALRGLVPALAQALPAARLGFDYAGLPWPDCAGQGALPDGVAPGQVVLEGADPPAALEWGRAHGITLFEIAA